MKNGRRQFALRDTSEKAREELNEIRESLKLKQGGWALFKINRNVRRAVFLGMLLQAMQKFHLIKVLWQPEEQLFPIQPTELCGFPKLTSAHLEK